MTWIAQTERLRLRPFTRDDLPALAPICADPEVMRHTLAGPWSDERTLRFLEQRCIAGQAADGYSPWAVVRREDERLLGFCGLLPQVVEGLEELEIGYRLARDAWGRGYATEAAVASRDFARDVLLRQRVISLIQPANVASARVAEKVGMTPEREARFKDVHVVVWSMRLQAPGSVG